MESENMNYIANSMNYIYWKNEAEYIVLSREQMLEKLTYLRANRKIAASNSKRDDYDETTYGIQRKGDYYSIYICENDNYYVYSCNLADNTKNSKKLDKRSDKLFDEKFKELNGLSLRKAFGFVDKTIKRCIPRQFYYKDDFYCDSILSGVSSIDASSQYASGCLGKLPDSHTKIGIPGTAKPTAEYPFAFYASGHLAIYNEFDTHDWLDTKLAANLFRLDKNDEYRLINCEPDKDFTILMKASEYEMTDTWNYFYNLKKACKKDSDEYLLAKLVMNSCIGCWHRKDKNKKAAFTYDDHGSYQLAHIVAVAIARGNNKILNKVNEIGLNNILHICVDGIIYSTDEKFGIDESRFGEFSQEFLDCDFCMLDYNVYAAEKDGKPVKFRHGSYDLIYGHEIDDSVEYGIKDLYKLDRKTIIEDIINE